VELKIFADHKYKAEHSNLRRAADALHWLAKHYPGRFVAWNVLYRVIVGCARTPLIDSLEATKLRRSASGIRKYLLREYKAHLLSVTVLGVRATFDDEDALRKALPPVVGRLNSARVAVEKVAEAIDVSAVPKVPQNAPYLSLLRDVKSITSYAERYPSLAALPGKGDADKDAKKKGK
jgi:hypothetical protein